jgi:2-iminobutanoate/2-iminopropanoate deaminase
MVGRIEEFKPAGKDMTSQARQAFSNIETILEEMDKNLSDISKVTSYLIEPRKHLQEYNDVWKEVFAEEPYPCHTLIGVHQLVQEAYLVEIDVEVTSDW